MASQRKRSYRSTPPSASARRPNSTIGPRNRSEAQDSSQGDNIKADNVSQAFLATAYHEAGHAVFYLRHTGEVNGIAIDPRDPREATTAGGIRLITPGIARNCFSRGGRIWRHWQRQAFCRAAECLAGPMAELEFGKTPLPEYLCAKYWNAPYFAEDIAEAENAIIAWFGAANSGKFSRSSVDERLKLVEGYVRTAFRNTKMRRAIGRIVALLTDQGGSVSRTQLDNFELPRVHLLQSYLALPGS